jgi:transcriptional regulator with XRE-family HTH domain
VAERSRENVALGRAVRSLRRELRISQEQLGDRSDLHRNAVGAAERGEKSVGFPTVVKICRGLDVSLAELMQRVERIEPILEPRPPEVDQLTLWGAR